MAAPQQSKGRWFDSCSSDFFLCPTPHFSLMRIKTISRSKDDYIKEKDGDVDKIHHNIDEKYHPFQQQREVAIVCSE